MVDKSSALRWTHMADQIKIRTDTRKLQTVLNEDSRCRVRKVGE